MNIYTTDKIRNVVLLGHGGSGKTSLTEAMAYLAGITSRMGKVTDGNTVSDYGKEEQKRQISINTSVVPIEWNGVKINILDTPGYFDFVGEVEEAVKAAGAAIIVINGKSGIEVGTEKAWELCEKYKLPRFVYVTNMDVDNASYRQIVEDLKEKYGKKIAPFNLPIRENEHFVGYVNVVSETGNRWQGKEVVPCEIPDYNRPNLKIWLQKRAKRSWSAILAARLSPNPKFVQRCVLTLLMARSFPYRWAPTPSVRAFTRCWMIL